MSTTVLKAPGVGATAISPPRPDPVRWGPQRCTRIPGVVPADIAGRALGVPFGAGERPPVDCRSRPENKQPRMPDGRFLTALSAARERLPGGSA